MTDFIIPIVLRLPRLCADCAFGSYFYDAWLCENAVASDRIQRLQQPPGPRRTG